MVADEYLVRKKKPGVAHIWVGNDTACRMWGTGGIRKEKYQKVADIGALPVCLMCEINHKKGK